MYYTMSNNKYINPECTPLLPVNRTGYNVGYYMNCIKLYWYDWFSLLYLSAIMSAPYVLVLIYHDIYFIHGMNTFVNLCCLFEIIFIKMLNKSCLQICDIGSYSNYYVWYIVVYQIVYVMFIIYLDNDLFVTECSNYMKKNNIKNMNCNVITRNCYCLLKYVNAYNYTVSGITNCNSNTFDYMHNY
jgi:hypothetical protein